MPVDRMQTVSETGAASGSESEAGAHLELFLVQERATLDAIHGAAVAAVYEGRLADDIGAVTFVAAAGIVGAPVTARPCRSRGHEPHDGGAGAPLHRLGPLCIAPGPSKPPGSLPTRGP